jgi:hypothetical protein
VQRAAKVLLQRSKTDRDLGLTGLGETAEGHGAEYINGLSCSLMKVFDDEVEFGGVEELGGVLSRDVIQGVGLPGERDVLAVTLDIGGELFPGRRLGKAGIHLGSDVLQDAQLRRLVVVGTLSPKKEISSSVPPGMSVSAISRQLRSGSGQ